MDQAEMKRRMRIMLLAVGILFGGIFIYKFINGLMLKHFMAKNKTVVSVSTTKPKLVDWRPTILSTGTLQAINGVNVTTELAGMVKYIYFNPGSKVKAGEVLVQLKADSDIALLNSLKAKEELARITYQRDKAQFAVNAVSKQVVDTDVANLKSFVAQVAEQAAIVEKKTIRAPFAGRLGVSRIDPGRYLNAGNPITTLQVLNPIYVNFFIPQQYLNDIKLNQTITVTADAFPKQVFQGKITTINPIVEVNTRNFEVQGLIDNPQELLVPGMFVNVEVITGMPKKILALPQTAISYNSYGSLVYVVETREDEDGNVIRTVKQHFVTTGEARGDMVAILGGVSANQTIVSSGQNKLKNDVAVKINNSVEPSEQLHPNLPNER